MTSHKIVILLIWSFFLMLTSNAENQIAQIKDHDGI